jgi:hypothetical protein
MSYLKNGKLFFDFDLRDCYLPCLIVAAKAKMAAIILWLLILTLRLASARVGCKSCYKALLGPRIANYPLPF